MIVWQELGRLEPLAASIFAAFNAVYFLRYLHQHRDDATAARLSAGALSLLFLGGCSEGVLLVYLVQAQPDVQSSPGRRPSGRWPAASRWLAPPAFRSS